jgi:hypothetical protein
VSFDDSLFDLRPPTTGSATGQAEEHLRADAKEKRTPDEGASQTPHGSLPSIMNVEGDQVKHRGPERRAAGAALGGN